MVATWPADQGQRGLREGFSRQLAENRIVSDTDTGGGKSRLRSSNAPEPFRLAMAFTADQVERFWRWWHEEIGQGTGDFWFPAPATHGLAIATDEGEPILTDEGEPIEIEDWILVRFAPTQPPPTFERRMGLKYVAVFALEKLW